MRVLAGVVGVVRVGVSEEGTNSGDVGRGDWNRGSIVDEVVTDSAPCVASSPPTLVSSERSVDIVPVRDSQRQKIQPQPSIEDHTRRRETLRVNLEDIDRIPQIDNTLSLFRIGLIHEDRKEVLQGRERA